MAATTWQEKVADKQKRCLEKIPKQWLLPSALSEKLQKPLESNPNRLIEMHAARLSGILTDRELDVTENYEVKQLLEALATGKLSAVEVTTAFCKRAAVAQQLMNCLTETYFDEAIERAHKLDDLRAKGQLGGPLHGLPVSVKDSFQIAGSEASIGYVSYLGRISEENSPLTEVLLRQGAIIHVKTNIPQTLMTADSQNNIFGRTLNPHNTMLGAGGSSGGEGATVAFRASAIGIGTDIAGSIRIPALCCGTYGFKPTSSRIPYGRQSSPSRAGIEFFLPSAGPLANDIDALHIMTQSIIDARPANFDVTALDVSWRRLQKQETPKLRLGLLAEDPVYPLHPPVQRALNDAVALLQAQGHEIIPLTAEESQTSDPLEIAWMFFSLDSTTGMSHIHAGGEPVIASITNITDASKKFSNKSVADIAELEGVPRVAALNVKRNELMDRWRRIWLEKKIDAVIAPAAQHTAVPHDRYLMPPYTALLNTLDYPACVIPFGRATKEIDPEPMVMANNQIGANYDPQVMDGAPTCIQIFTSRMRDEECLQIATVVDKCLRRRK